MTQDRPNDKFGQPVGEEETENSVNKIERKIVWNLSTINHVHENRYEWVKHKRKKSIVRK